MHGGPLEPSVHLFSFGAWCKGNEGTRVKGLSCTKSASRLGQRPVTSPKAPPSTGGLPQRRPPLTPQPVVKVLI